MDLLERAAIEEADLGDDLPLVLSTLEDASVSKALSLDSNLSEVVEAVAKGDIKPLADRKPWRQKAEALPQGNSVGRGPVGQEADMPMTVKRPVPKSLRLWYRSLLSL